MLPGAPRPGQHSPHAGCRSSGVVSSAAPGCRQGGPTQHCPEEGCANKLSKPQPFRACQRPSSGPNLCSRIPGRAWVDAVVPTMGESLQHSFKSQTFARHISENSCFALLLSTNCPRVPLAKHTPLKEASGNQGGGPASPKPKIFLWCPCKLSVAISAGDRACSVCTKWKVRGCCRFLTRGGKETEKAKTHDVGLLFAPNARRTRFTAACVRKKKGSKRYRRDKTESEREPSCPGDGVALASVSPEPDEGSSCPSPAGNEQRRLALPKQHNLRNRP